MSVIAQPALTVTKGEDRIYTLTHQTSATDTTPINISGWTIAVTAKVSPEGPVVLSKVGTLVTPASGIYSFTVGPSDTNLTPQQYLLDIWRTDSGAKTVMALGTWTVLPDVKY